MNLLSVVCRQQVHKNINVRDHLSLDTPDQSIRLFSNGHEIPQNFRLLLNFSYYMFKNSILKSPVKTRKPKISSKLFSDDCLGGGNGRGGEGGISLGSVRGTGPAKKPDRGTSTRGGGRGQAPPVRGGGRGQAPPVRGGGRGQAPPARGRGGPRGGASYQQDDSGFGGSAPGIEHIKEARILTLLPFYGWLVENRPITTRMSCTESEPCSLSHMHSHTPITSPLLSYIR